MSADEQKEESVGKRILKFLKNFFVSGMTFLVLILPGIALDRVYYGKSTWASLVQVVNKLKQIGYEWNISYTKLVEFSSGNFGPLITAVSIMISIGVNMANRTENKAYGIPRVSISTWKLGNLNRWIMRIMFWAPPMMLTAIHLKGAVTGYLILGYSYIFLVWSYFRLYNSYNPERDRRKVAEQLVNTVVKGKHGSDVSMQSLLENIRSSVEKEGNWTSIEQLYAVVLDRGKALGQESCFALSYRFFITVFCRDGIGLERGEAFFKKRVLGQKDRRGDISEYKEFVILWAMLCALFSYLTEERIGELLTWVANLPEQYRENDKCDRAVRRKDYEILTGMLLLQIEYWFRRNEIKDERVVRILPMLWEHGKILLNDKWKEIRDACDMLGELLSEKCVCGICMSECIDNLLKDYQKGYGRSIIYNLIQSERRDFNG